MRHYFEDALDEILEIIWTEREAGRNSLQQVKDLSREEQSSELIAQLTERGLVVVSDDTIEFTDDGETAASSIIRGHRLAAVLLTEVMGMTEELVEEFACRFEHCVNPEVMDNICTLLGHPPVGPFGNPIPRGACCDKQEQDVRQLVIPLSDLPLGADARIVYIRPSHHHRLDRLAAFGVVPDSTLQLHQRLPSYVVKIGETDLALEQDVAQEIFVRSLCTSNGA